jgi:N-acetyl-alpha-D-muramate 1-phosphate uridylyltransferase
VSLPVAILAGGLATRLHPLTQAIPKILLEVAGRPFAEHQVELLKRQGIRRVVFCVGYLGDQVEAALGDGARWGMAFHYVFDGPTLAGTAGAIRRALPLLGEAFFVMYGDSYLQCDFAAVEAAFSAARTSGLMTVFRNEDRWDRSNVRFEGQRILCYDKQRHDASMDYIDYGLGVLTPRAFAPWLDGPTPLDLVAVYQRLVADGDLAGYEVDSRFYEIGSHQGLEETRALLEAHRGPTV